MRQWYRMAADTADPSVMEIHIIDFIGDWVDQMMNEVFDESITVTAKAFIQELSKIPESVKTLRVHVNSPGGDVFGAVNIANALRDQRATKGRTVETIVDGMAASAASLVIMAGDPVRISDNGLVMVHNAWTIALGNAAEMRKTADILDKFRDSNIIPTYQWHSTLSAEDIVALMDAETWMDADEAIANGFADDKVEGLKAAASIDPRAAARLAIPEKYRDRVNALLSPQAGDEPPTMPEDEPPVTPEPTPATTPEPDPKPEPDPEIVPSAIGPRTAGASIRPVPADAADVVRLCGDAGLGIEFAQALIADALTADAVSARIASEKQTRIAEEARETEIRALCKAAKQLDLAAGYVAGGMKVQQVRQHLTLITAKLDKAEIDGGLEPDYGTRRKPVIDVTAVYAELNKPRLLKE